MARLQYIQQKQSYLEYLGSQQPEDAARGDYAPEFRRRLEIVLPLLLPLGEKAFLVRFLYKSNLSSMLLCSRCSNAFKPPLVVLKPFPLLLSGRELLLIGDFVTLAVEGPLVVARVDDDFLRGVDDLRWCCGSRPLELCRRLGEVVGASRITGSSVLPLLAQGHDTYTSGEQYSGTPFSVTRTVMLVQPPSSLLKRRSLPPFIVLAAYSEVIVGKYC